MRSVARLSCPRLLDNNRKEDHPVTAILQASGSGKDVRVVAEPVQGRFARLAEALTINISQHLQDC